MSCLGKVHRDVNPLFGKGDASYLVNSRLAWTTGDSGSNKNKQTKK